MFPGFSDAEEAAERSITVSMTQVRSNGRQLAELGRLLNDGTVRVAIDSALPLADARKAHERAPPKGTFEARSWSLWYDGRRSKDHSLSGGNVGPQGTSQMSENNKAVLRRANAAVAKGDYEGFLSHCTDDVEWTFVGDKTLKGKEAVRRYMSATYIEPPQFVVAQLIAEGDFVTAIGEIDVTDETGKTTHSVYCDVWRLRDGKLAELTAFVVEIESER